MHQHTHEAAAHTTPGTAKEPPPPAHLLWRGARACCCRCGRRRRLRRPRHTRGRLRLEGVWGVGMVGRDLSAKLGTCQTRQPCALAHSADPCWPQLSCTRAAACCINRQCTNPTSHQPAAHSHLRQLLLRLKRGGRLLRRRAVQPLRLLPLLRTTASWKRLGDGGDAAASTCCIKLPGVRLTPWMASTSRSAGCPAAPAKTKLLLPAAPPDQAAAHLLLDLAEVQHLELLAASNHVQPVARLQQGGACVVLQVGPQLAGLRQDSQEATYVGLCAPLLLGPLPRAK